MWIRYQKFFLLLLFLAWRFTPLKEKSHQIWFDWQTQQQPIQHKAEIDKVLSELERISYQDLSPAYLQNTKSDLPNFKKILENGAYYKVKGTQIFKFVVGDFRIKDFLPKDDYYYDHLSSLNGKSRLY